MIYYHFTDYKLWKNKISKKGLVPQKYYREDLIELWTKHGFKHKRVIWLWPFANEKLMSDFFLFQRTTKKIKHGILLKVIIDKQDEKFLATRILKRLKKRWHRRVLLRHDLSFGDKPIYFHKNVFYDLYPKKISPENITPLLEIEEVIRAYDEDPQGLFYPETAGKIFLRTVFKHKKVKSKLILDT